MKRQYNATHDLLNHFVAVANPILVPVQQRESGLASNSSSGIGVSATPPAVTTITPKVFRASEDLDPGLGVFTNSQVPPGHGKVCTDLNGRKIPSGLHYVPGPDECTLCVCEDGGPKWCKAVLCSPPQDCKSFRVGSSCCDFICLDDSLNNGDGVKTGGPFRPFDIGAEGLADVVPKVIVVGITAILSLSLLLFLIHRLRQKQIQGRLNSSASRRCDDCDDSRSLDFSMDFYDRGPPPPQYMAWWKPDSGYFPPRGEAPPPYEEAIASTSNCLPMTFANVYNNNHIISTTSNNGANATRNNTSGGWQVSSTANGIVTTSLTTPNTLPEGVAPCASNESFADTPTTQTATKDVTSSAAAEPSSSSSISQTPQEPGPSSKCRNSKGSAAPVPSSSESLLPLRVPPSYDDSVKNYRHSVTLPHPTQHRRVPFFEPGGASSQSQQQQQRFSLQLHLGDCNWSSGSSSSTLSLSTPNMSPNERPPSVTSSSSSNASQGQAHHV